MTQTIFLIGFMGAGKSTLAAKLARKLGYRAIDLDRVVEQKEGMGIHDLITSRGEGAFREIESRVLKELPLDKVVVATGGGSPCYYDNMDWMLARGRVVYLELDEAALYARLSQSKNAHRPLLKGLDEEGLRALIHERLLDRLPYYERAHVRCHPMKEGVEEIAKKVVGE